MSAVPHPRSLASWPLLSTLGLGAALFTIAGCSSNGAPGVVSQAMASTIVVEPSGDICRRLVLDLVPWGNKTDLVAASTTTMSAIRSSDELKTGVAGHIANVPDTTEATLCTISAVSGTPPDALNEFGGVGGIAVYGVWDDGNDGAWLAGNPRNNWE